MNPKNKKFKIDRTIQNINSIYDFEEGLNENSIRKAIEESRGNLPKFYLNLVEIHPTTYCDSKCEFCYGKKLRPNYKEELSLKDIESIFKDIKTNFSKDDPLIIISGLYSEPLVHSNIKEIIDMIGKYKLRFGLYTNGIKMNEDIIKTIVNASKKPSYISFNISSALKSKEKKEELFKKIKSIIKKKSDKLQINAPILAIPKKYNYKTFNGLIKELIDIGVDNIRLSLPWKKHEKKNIWKSCYIENKKTEEIIKDFYKIREKYPGIIKIREPKDRYYPNSCYVMGMSLTIDAEGNVYPCPKRASPLLKNLFSYGNIKEKKLSEIWDNSEKKKLFKKVNPTKEGCLCCPASEKFNSICERYK